MAVVAVVSVVAVTTMMTTRTRAQRACLLARPVVRATVMAVTAVVMRMLARSGGLFLGGVVGDNSVGRAG